MTYKDSEGHIYNGGSMTRLVDGVLFSGVPTVEQLAAWGYEEVLPPEPYVPTVEDLKRARMDAILSELQATDYLALKAFEGEDMSEHPNWREDRAALRREYRALESELNQE